MTPTTWHVGLAAGGGDVRHESLSAALHDAVTSSLAFEHSVVAVRDQNGVVLFLAHQGQIFQPMTALARAIAISADAYARGQQVPWDLAYALSQPTKAHILAWYPDAPRDATRAQLIEWPTRRALDEHAAIGPCAYAPRWPA